MNRQDIIHRLEAVCQKILGLEGKELTHDILKEISDDLDNLQISVWRHQIKNSEVSTDMTASYIIWDFHENICLKKEGKLVNSRFTDKTWNIARHLCSILEK